jgi:hypothetical protein
MDEDKIIDGNASSISEMLGTPVDITDVTENTDIDALDGLIFELYKEAAIVVNLTAHLLSEADARDGGLLRNQAICSGFLVRIVKFMVAVIELSTKGNRGEVILALNRSIMESAINLEFLVRTKESKYFDQFVAYSLGPERELYDMIQANVSARNGQVLPIERRMLNSIEQVCKASGVKIEQVDRKYRDWGENLRNRLKALDKEQQYVSVQRIPSHAVHGTWVDLYFHHLEYHEEADVFSPDNRSTHSDARSLGPIALFVLGATAPYLQRFFASIPEAELVLKRITDLQGRIVAVEAVHERLLAARG